MARYYILNSVRSINASTFNITSTFYKQLKKYMIMFKRTIYTIFMTVALTILFLVGILSVITAPIQYILFNDAFKFLYITNNLLSKIQSKVVDFCFGKNYQF